MNADARAVRVFISSTFRDMSEERHELMTQTWPALRRLCAERHVEFVEVDLRWGIAEAQSTRQETLKFCLDEIRACRPFFIGLLGERYGWTPGDGAFTADLQEEQPWLTDLRGRSVTELEILHGALNDPGAASRAFFYFRDPAYVDDRGPDFQSETAAETTKQAALKALIRATCATKRIPLRENYADPRELAAMVLADLTAAIDAQFPTEEIPDPLTREAQAHEAFAAALRHVYVARQDEFDTLDRHASGDTGPLVVSGPSGSGKSALLANWLTDWRRRHPGDVILQHYIGGTADSADHWRLMTRVMSEIKRWSGDHDLVPTQRADIRREFPAWLAKARARAARDGVRIILVLDGINQLEDQERARSLGWLPDHSCSGPFRVIVSTVPAGTVHDDASEALAQRGWRELRVAPLAVADRRRMIQDYLARYGKTLDEHRLDLLANADLAVSPLYLRIILDDLRVTGTHDRLDERLVHYLSAPDIPALLQHVLARYQRDYERDRTGLVRDALGLIAAARRGLSEAELLQLLRPAGQSQLPAAVWAPLRAALEDAVIARGGVLNFAHEFLRGAVDAVFLRTPGRQDAYRRQLVDYFESVPVSARACDELPWLLKAVGARGRLKACLMDIERFLHVQRRDDVELRRYWVEDLAEQREMGRAYLESFERWRRGSTHADERVAHVANQLGLFLLDAACYSEAEPLLRLSLEASVDVFGAEHPEVATRLTNLAQLLHQVNRRAEAEPLMRRAIDITERRLGSNHHDIAVQLNNLAELLKASHNFAEAESLLRRALSIAEASLGAEHPEVSAYLYNLAHVLQVTDRMAEAEPLIGRALDIAERNFGRDHPNVAIGLNNLAGVFQATGRLDAAETLMRCALHIDEHSFGGDHPNVAITLNNIAGVLIATRRYGEAADLLSRALAVTEASLGPHHPQLAPILTNMGDLFFLTRYWAEAERVLRRALAISESHFGPDDAVVLMRRQNLARLLDAAPGA